MDVVFCQTDYAPRSGRQSSFTLIEMTAVLVLLGVLAALATLSLASSVRQSRMDDAVAEFAMHDHLVRQRAQQFGTPLAIDLLVGPADVIRLHGNSPNDAGPFHLPSGVRITRLLMAGQSTTRADYGEVSIPCSAQGLTPSYAVQLASSGNDRRWLFIAGLTGQATSMNDEQQVEQVLQTLQTSRP